MKIEAVFASVKPTTQFDFKGVKISITKAVINVGTNMSIDKMNKYLLGTQNEEEPAASPDEFDEEDTKTGWAFGVNGSVSFEREEMQPRNNTKFTAANVNGSAASVAQPKKDTKTSDSIATSFIVGEFDNRKYGCGHCANISMFSGLSRCCHRCRLAERTDEHCPRHRRCGVRA